MKAAAILSLSFLVPVGGTLAAGTQVRVTGNRVNLRCKPGLGGEVVHVASRGDLLTAVKGIGGDWVEVAAPKGTALYVYAELVRDGVVAVPTLQARSGDGIDHQTVFVLKKGDKVAGRGRVGDWLKIAPPRGCTLWISRKYVESAAAPPKPRPAPKPKPKPAVTRPPAPKPKPEVVAVPKPPRPAPTPPPPVSWKAPVHTVAPEPELRTKSGVFEADELVGSMDQGLAASYSGTLHKAGPVFRKPSNYCIIDRDSRGRGVTQCYVLGSTEQLAALLGHRMRVEGDEYWLQGVRHPVLVPKRIYRKR